MLTPTNHFRSMSSGDVEFLMMSGSREVICLVTREALEGLARETPGAQSLLDVFARDHARIEAVASNSFDKKISAPVVQYWMLAHETSTR